MNFFMLDCYIFIAAYLTMRIYKESERRDEDPIYEVISEVGLSRSYQ